MIWSGPICGLAGSPTTIGGICAGWTVPKQPAGVDREAFRQKRNARLVASQPGHAPNPHAAAIERVQFSARAPSRALVGVPVPVKSIGTFAIGI